MGGLFNLLLLCLTTWGLYRLFLEQLELSETWATWLAVSAGSALFAMLSSYTKMLLMRSKLKWLVQDKSRIDETADLLEKSDLPQGCLVLLGMCAAGVAAWMLLYLYLPWEPASTIGLVGRHLTCAVGALVFGLFFLVAQAQLLTPEKLLTKSGASLEYVLLVLVRKKERAEIKKSLQQGTPKPAPPPPKKTKTLFTPVATKPPPPAQPSPQTAVTPPSPRTNTTPKPAAPFPVSTGHDVFISYSSKDSEVTNNICATLEERGIRCWIAPRDMPPGVPWSEALIDALSGSRVLLLVFSANSNISPQVNREVERAVAKGIPILPLRIEDVTLSKSMEYFISASHWLDALTRPLDNHLIKLAQAVNRLLSRVGDDSVSGHQALTEAIRMTTGGTVSVTRAPARTTRQKDPDLILLDALCCVMSADGMTSYAEKSSIRGLMKKVKSHYTQEQVDEHMNQFGERVAREGFADVVDAVTTEAKIFKRLGKADMLISCLDAVAKSEYRVHNSEQDMIQRFRSIVS